MGLFVNQRESKDQAIAAIETLRDHKDPTELERQACYDLVRINSRGWGVDPDKLMSLVRSQVLSGNHRGAIKVIEGAIPDERMKFLPAIFFAIVLWPFRFVWSIISLGFVRK
jgi:hypothetical protein